MNARVLTNTGQIGISVLLIFHISRWSFIFLLFLFIGRPRRRWVDNIRMDLGEVGWGDVDWIGLAKDRKRWRATVNSVLNLRVP
jgi:hypothetical protein